jgi:Tfp pilus assembly protein PilF
MKKAAIVLSLSIGLFAGVAVADSLSTTAKFVNDAVKSNPDNASAWRALAHVDQLLGQNALAQRAANKADKLAHQSTHTGSLETAAKFVNEAVRTNPNNASAWAALARIDQLGGHTDRGASEYMKAVSLNPFNPVLWLQFANASMQYAGSAFVVSEAR